MHNKNLINSPADIITQTEQMALAKYRTSNNRLVLLGILAGAYIAMGGLLSHLVSYGMPAITAGNPGLQKLLAGSFFPIGLWLVVLVGAELFTGNNANLVPAVMNRLIPWHYLVKNWLIAYVTNFIGAFGFVFIFVHLCGVVDTEPWRLGIISVAEAKCSQPWITIFIKGIGANWLVSLAVWLGLSAGTSMGRIIGLWSPIMAFVVMGFEHCIANMFYIPLGILKGADITWGAFFSDNLIPATLGNIVGGTLLVGLIYWYIYGKKTL